MNIPGVTVGVTATKKWERLIKQHICYLVKLKAQLRCCYRFSRVNSPSFSQNTTYKCSLRNTFEVYEVYNLRPMYVNNEPTSPLKRLIDSLCNQSSRALAHFLLIASVVNKRVSERDGYVCVSSTR